MSVVIEKYAFAWDLQSNSGVIAIEGKGGEKVKRPISNATELLALKALLDQGQVVLKNNNLLVTGFEDLVD